MTPKGSSLFSSLFELRHHWHDPKHATGAGWCRSTSHEYYFALFANFLWSRRRYKTLSRTWSNQDLPNMYWTIHQPTASRSKILFFSTDAVLNDKSRRSSRSSDLNVQGTYIQAVLFDMRASISFDYALWFVSSFFFFFFTFASVVRYFRVQ